MDGAHDELTAMAIFMRACRPMLFPKDRDFQKHLIACDLLLAGLSEVGSWSIIFCVPVCPGLCCPAPASPASFSFRGQMRL